MVMDVQFNASIAAILCEGHEILLYDLQTWELTRRVQTSALAMAVGARWIAYPGFIPDRDRSQSGAPVGASNASLEDDTLVDPHPHYAGGVTSSPSTYTAIDVAQNVASGLYYLSEIGRATIVPYLSSSPGTAPSAPSPHRPAQNTNGANNGTGQSDKRRASSHAGWVVVQDLETERVLCNFQAHGHALVTLSFDPSGTLLATSSTSGQNVHMYRLLPALMHHRKSKQQATDASSSTHQLLYKLQRGITHASIQDIAFSQDSKWVSVTTAHGTSHLYAIHPEGARVSPETHVTSTTTAPSSPESSSYAGSWPVNDFYAVYRPLETTTLAQVLKIRHKLATSDQASTGALAGTSPGTMVESALDASQAFFTQLRQSTTLDLASYYTDDDSLEGRRRRNRRRLSCLFAHDGLALVVCCDQQLKMYDMTVLRAPLAASPVTNGSSSTQHHVMAASARSPNASHGNGKSSIAFGFEMHVDERAAWDLRVPSRGVISMSLEDLQAQDAVVPPGLFIHAKSNTKSELRTFAQRSLPLWAHPKVIFKAVDSEHPEGLVLQVKRKGPYADSGAADGVITNGAGESGDQLFVLEMDSYFGIGGSPVFNGQSETTRRTSASTMDMPPLDLRESINMAMSSTLSAPVAPHAVSADRNGMADDADPMPVASWATKEHGGNGKKKRRSKVSQPQDKPTGPTTALQFTLQDMYFALPDAGNGTT